MLPSARRRTAGQAILTIVVPGAGQMLRGAALSGFLAILVMVTAAMLVIPNGALVPSLDVLPIPGAGWMKRLPLLILFLLTYALFARTFPMVSPRLAGITLERERAHGQAMVTAEFEHEEEPKDYVEPGAIERRKFPR